MKGDEIAMESILPVGLLGWEIEALGAHNPLRPGRLDWWFEFLVEEAAGVGGDVVELGVWQGASVVTDALLLREVNPAARIYGFDSFAGFPPSRDPRDEFEHFYSLHRDGRISTEHLLLAEQALRIKSAAAKSASRNEISTSGNFSNTSEELVLAKLEYFNLQNVTLVPGYFHETLARFQSPELCGILFDSDLYSGYRLGLELLWPRLRKGGVAFLDEYFSLKFPGPRRAVDEFLAGRDDAGLEKRLDHLTGFERWRLRKTK